MSENQALQTTVDDIFEFNEILKGNFTSNVRIALEKVNRRILSLQQTLTELRANEAVVKGRIYNNLSTSYIQNKVIAGVGTLIDPQQSFDKQNVSKSPDPAIGSNIYKAMTEEYGVKELYAELNRINNAIQKTMQLMNRDIERQKVLQNSIKDIKATIDKKQTFIEKTTGKVSPPTLDDLEYDKIQKSICANVALLYNLALAYNQYTMDSSGNYGYPDDASLPNNLLVMRQVFYSHVQQFPKYLQSQTDGTNTIPPLDTRNPGCAQNLSILQSDMEALRLIGKNDKISRKTQKYVADLVSIENDPTVSQGIDRKINPIPTESQSLNAQSKTFAKTASRTIGYVGSWESSSLAKVIQKEFKKKNAKLFSDLPICTNVIIPNKTSTDSTESAEDLVIKQLQENGAASFQAALMKAKSDQYILNMNLPSDAPDWVTQYVGAFGDQPFGRIYIPVTPPLPNTALFVVYVENSITDSSSVTAEVSATLNAQKKVISIASTHTSEISGNPIDPIGLYSYRNGNSINFYGEWYSSQK